jgi:class 3 adenylate cyclase
MEPRIQYAKTADGVSIAFSVAGEGKPYVLMPMFPWCHIEKMWQIPVMRRMLEKNAQERRLVQYDSRGSGLSERRNSDFSLEGHLLDLEAVVQHLGLETFDLSARQHAGPVAITYAARNPDRVSHLILTNTYARASDYISSQQAAVHELAKKDWVLFTETAARFSLSWNDEEMARVMASFLRECVSQDMAVAVYRAVAEFDTTSLLGQVKVPTLVVHDRLFQYVSLEVSKSIAARIPDARLVAVERTPGVAAFLDTERASAAIDEFLGEGEQVTLATTPPEAGPFRAVLFTDLVGHTEMMSRLGDEQGREVLREHERITRDVLKAHDGAEVKTLGDGFMASFGSVTRAVECAIALQRAFPERNQSASEPLAVRVGLNAGQPIEEDGDLFGATVILAARIAARAEAGEILVANAVRELCAGKGFPFADRGEFVAKGFEEPARVYVVKWGDA